LNGVWWLMLPYTDQEIKQDTRTEFKLGSHGVWTDHSVTIFLKRDYISFQEVLFPWDWFLKKEIIYGERGAELRVYRPLGSVVDYRVEYYFPWPPVAAMWGMFVLLLRFLLRKRKDEDNEIIDQLGSL